VQDGLTPPQGDPIRERFLGIIKYASVSRGFSTTQGLGFPQRGTRARHLSENRQDGVITAGREERGRGGLSLSRTKKFFQEGETT